TAARATRSVESSRKALRRFRPVTRAPRCLVGPSGAPCLSGEGAVVLPILPRPRSWYGGGRHGIGKSPSSSFAHAAHVLLGLVVRDVASGIVLGVRRSAS